ncbi:MAG: hypothetical protein FJY99_04235 [Candidatus Sericytochromatia bacterium]|nr:hypothetical protein [Candidatus Tanganyikabacteria bacterium]
MRKADAVRDKSPLRPVRNGSEATQVAVPLNPAAAQNDKRRNNLEAGEVGKRVRSETRDEIARVVRRQDGAANGAHGDVSETYADLVADSIRQPPSATDRTILRNIADVTKVVPPTSEAGKKLDDARANNAAAETRALEALSPADRAAYQRLARGVAGDAAARLALQVLLLCDRLPGQPAERGGPDALEGLDRLLGAAPLAEGIDRKALVGQLVREMAAPAAISQKGKGTCTVTSLQIFMADRRPAEYVRIVTRLASPDGKAVLSDGSTVLREPGTAGDDGSKRSIPSRLWQPAMMERANDRDYDNAADNFDGDDDRRGLNVGDIGNVFRAVTGDRVLSRSVKGFAWKSKERLWEKLIGDSLTRGDAVLVGLQWTSVDAKSGKERTSGHKVLVTGFDDDVVHFTNPWGQEEVMSRRDFTQRLKDINVLIPGDSD